MPNMSLSSFMKALLLSPAAKATHYNSYLKGKGFQYYYKLNEAIKAITLQNASYDEAELIINTITEKARRQNCKTGFAAFNKAFLNGHGDFIEPPSGTLTSPLGYLTINVRPSACLVHGGRKKIISIWNTKSPSLNQITAAVGLTVMRRALPHDDKNEHIIADLRKKGSYIAESFSPAISAMLASELAFADTFYEQAAGVSPSAAAG